MNKASINCYSNRQEIVEVTTFGAELCAINIGVEMAEALSCKIQMFEVPIDGSANVFCDNKYVYKNTITPESVLNIIHNYIEYHM